MSLFGDDDAGFGSPKAQKKTNALFDEPASNQSSSLFADEDTTAGNDADWGFTPKKAGRGDPVKSLLANTNVPDSYVDAYDALVETGHNKEGGVDVEGVQLVMGEAGLRDMTKINILKIVGPAKHALSRNEFFVVMALIGLAQEKEELSLDAVDERRRSMDHL